MSRELVGRGWEVVLEEGEALRIPPLWWHQAARALLPVLVASLRSPALSTPPRALRGGPRAPPDGSLQTCPKHPGGLERASCAEQADRRGSRFTLLARVHTGHSRRPSRFKGPNSCVTNESRAAGWAGNLAHSDWGLLGRDFPSPIRRGRKFVRCCATGLRPRPLSLECAAHRLRRLAVGCCRSRCLQQARLGERHVGRRLRERGRSTSASPPKFCHAGHVL